jgi:hypothetical protein
MGGIRANACPTCEGSLKPVSVIVDEGTGPSGKTALAGKLDMPNPPEVTAAPYVWGACGLAILAFILGIALGHGPVAGFTFYILLAGAIAVLIAGFVKRDKERKAVNLARQHMRSVWQRPYYCRECGIVVFPGDRSNYVHRDDMRELLTRPY